MTSNNGDWRKVGDEILSELVNVKADEQLKFIKSKIKLLPPDQQDMVGHFVSLGAIAGGNIVKSNGGAEVSRHKSISIIVGMGVVVTIVLLIAGIYLVSMTGSQASSKIELWGAKIETDHLGLGCIFVAAIGFLLLSRKALSRI